MNYKFCYKLFPTSFKIFGKVIKNNLIRSMDNYFSPDLSACRAHYVTCAFTFNRGMQNKLA